MKNKSESPPENTKRMNLHSHYTFLKVPKEFIPTRKYFSANFQNGENAFNHKKLYCINKVIRKEITVKSSLVQLLQCWVVLLQMLSSSTHLDPAFPCKLSETPAISV